MGNSCGDESVLVFEGCIELIDGFVAETKQSVMVTEDVEIY